MNTYGFIVALSLITLTAVVVWALVQFGLVRRSQKKGRVSAFRHREPEQPTTREVEAQRAADHERGIERRVYKPVR